MTDSEKLDLLLEKVTSMDSHFEGIDSRFEGMDSRFEGIESRLEKMDDRFERIESRLEGVEGRLEKMDSHFEEIESRLDKMEVRLEKVENDVHDTKLILENEIRINIQRLAEGHFDLSRILHDAMQPSNEVEKLAIKVNMLETDVNELKRKVYN
jgi:archaellum component FlaC